MKKKYEELTDVGKAKALLTASLKLVEQTRNLLVYTGDHITLYDTTLNMLPDIQVKLGRAISELKDE